MVFRVDTPEDSAGFLLWQTTISWQRLVKKALEPYGVSHAQFVLIAILLWWHGQKKDLTQVDLIQLSKLDKMTVSKALKKLVAMKVVDRREHHTDTRAKIVCLTPVGFALATELVPRIEDVDDRFFSCLDCKIQTHLKKALHTLAEQE